jgi:hypothetical protein
MARSLEKMPNRASNIGNLLLPGTKPEAPSGKNNRFVTSKQGKEKAREKMV